MGVEGGENRYKTTRSVQALYCVTLTHQACRHSFFAMDRTHDPPPQACCSCSRPWGGVTHPTTLSRQHGAPTMCPHRAIISRAGGWAFEHGEPSSHKLLTALRCMLWVCEVFGACTGRAGIPPLRALGSSTHTAAKVLQFATRSCAVATRSLSIDKATQVIKQQRTLQ